MKIRVLTLFPEMFVSPLQASLLGKAVKKGILDIKVINLRDYALDKHQQADDYPFGGGAGMVMKADVIIRAVSAVKEAEPGLRVIYLGPAGKRLEQSLVRELAGAEGMILLCGHYEGIDERAMSVVDDTISIGDYILTGGELPAMVLIDAVARLVPGVLGSAESAGEESFSDGLLEYPHYTRPREVEGMEVPEVLLSGNHEEIRRWRKKQSLYRTLTRRPDLLFKRPLSDEEKKLLWEVINEFGEGNRT